MSAPCNTTGELSGGRRRVHELGLKMFHKSFRIYISSLYVALVVMCDGSMRTQNRECDLSLHEE
jgi:hypothetical protein